MQRASYRPRSFTRLLIAAALMLLLGPSTGALAQDSEHAAGAASSVPEQPRRRERRRAAEAAAASTDAQARAAEAAAAVTAAEPAAETVESELVCKSIEVAGSKIARRVCGTPEQWASQGRRASRAAQDAIQEIRDRSSFPAAPEVPTEASAGIPVAR
jgi:hypothetical protein